MAIYNMCNPSFRYDIALFLLMYILPLIILFATYIPITVKLWSDRGLGEVTRAQVEGIKSKRRVSSKHYSYLNHEVFNLSFRLNCGLNAGRVKMFTCFTTS